MPRTGAKTDDAARVEYASLYFLMDTGMLMPRKNPVFTIFYPDTQYLYAIGCYVLIATTPLT
jgi:hypothetical protein